MPRKSKATTDAPAVHFKQSSTYSKRHSKLQQQLEEQRALLRGAQTALRLANERDRILLDMCLHQELLAHILQVHQQHLQDVGRQRDDDRQQHGDGDDDHQQPQQSGASSGVHWQQQQQPPQQQQQWQQSCTTGSSHAGHDGSGPAVQSYAARLLREATPQQLRRVQEMTADAWMTFFQDVFINLLVRLEFVSRSKDDEDEEEEPLPPPPDADLLAVTLTTSLPSGSQLSVAGLHPSLDLQQLEALVDEAVTLVLLSYLHNHLPLLEACTYNIATRQPAVAPPGHWQRVAQRMKLSSMQVEHFQIVLDEAARLGRAEDLAAAAIVQRAASPSLLLAAATHMQQHAGSASTSGRGSVGTAYACPDTAATGTMHQQQEQQQQQKQQQQQEAGAGDGLQGEYDEGRINSQLRRHIHARILQLRLIVMCFFNTFSRTQIAQLCVFSFPFLPSITEVVRAACQLQRDRAASAGGEGADLHQYTREHLAQRGAVLQEQQQRWWQQLFF